MTELSKFLAIAADKKHLGSYYMIAKELDVPTSTVYRARDNGSLADQHCLKIAEIIGEEPIKVIAAKNADIAKDQKLKGFWKSVAAGIVVTTAMSSLPAQSVKAEELDRSVIKITGNRVSV